jgi:hypothetical protein
MLPGSFRWFEKVSVADQNPGISRLLHLTQEVPHLNVLLEDV